MPKRYWTGDAPTICDIDQKPIDKVFVDGRTTTGLWANMCPQCHARHGVGLGLGKGQKYEKQENNAWLKVEG